MTHNKKSDLERAKALEELMRHRQDLDGELRKLSRIISVAFLDLMGSTKYFETYGDVDGMVHIHKFLDFVIPIIENTGRIANIMGDTVLAVFEKPGDALLAMIEAQRFLASYNTDVSDADQQMHGRIGIMTGPAMCKDKDVYGLTVNTAARLNAAAKSDQILIVGPIVETARALSITTKKLPAVRLKGITAPGPIYEVLWQKLKK